MVSQHLGLIHALHVPNLGRSLSDAGVVQRVPYIQQCQDGPGGPLNMLLVPRTTGPSDTTPNTLKHQPG